MYVSISDAAVGAHIYGQKSYEPHVTKAIKRKLAPGMFFVDIGANIGYFSLLAAHLVGKEGRVFSFEPFQYNVKLLYLNAKINDFGNIEIYPFAVVDQRSLFAYDNMASNGVISEIGQDLHSILSTTLVYSIKLDDVLQDIERLDVIKIDVEGAEYMALSGAKRLLKRHRPTIFAEFSPSALQVISKVSAEAFLRLLLIDDDFSIAVLDKNGNMLDCKNDLAQVIGHFEAAGSDHIDIVAFPLGHEPSQESNICSTSPFGLAGGRADLALAGGTV